MYISKDKELKVEIIQLYQDVLAARHRERWKMTELVTRNYWQLEVTKNVGKYIDSCNLYQRIKNRIKALAGKLKLSEIPKKLQIYLMVDFITKFLLVASVICQVHPF